MDIVEELRKDPESGARRLEAEYKAGLLTLASRFCADSSDAEELVNRTFAAVVCGIDDYLEQSAFFGWMCQILKNIHANDIRPKSRRNEILVGSMPDIEDEGAGESIFSHLDHALLRDAIETLPREMKEVIVMHYLMEEPVSRVAKFIGEPVSTVKWRLHVARKALAAKLGVAAEKAKNRAEAAAKTAAGKSIIVIFALCVLTAAGAGARFAVVRLLSSAPATAQQQAANIKEAACSESAPSPAGGIAGIPDTPEITIGNIGSITLCGDAGNAFSIDSSFYYNDFSLTPQPEEPSMNATTLRTFAASAAFAAAGAAEASIKLPQLDSSAFSHKYEMEMPLTSEDVDGDGFADFTTNNCPTVSSHYGVCDYKFGASWYCMSMSDSGAGSAWRRFAPAVGEGYTIELRMKLNYKSAAATYALALTASDGSDCDMCLGFKDTGLTWNATAITNMVTTDAYHTYRVAKIPNEARFVLWCDGVLVRDNLGDAIANSGLNRLLLGAIGGAYGGAAYCSYLRFTKGAYAPKRGGKDSSEFSHRYEMDSSDTRFSPTGNASDWQLGGGASGLASLANGIFSVDQPKGATRYYATVGSMDPSISASTPFTLETKVRIGNAWDGTSGRVLNFYCGTPRFTANFFIGTSFVCWSSTYQVVHTGDNTDGMHVFRVTYEGDREDGFTLWRDGEKIGENLVGTTAYDHVRFGIASSSSHGGAFWMDYIRWTTDGVYEPFVPPPAFVVILR